MNEVTHRTVDTNAGARLSWCAARIDWKLDLYHGILRDLTDAYRRSDMEHAGKILDARQQMMALHQAAEQLAASGIGIPFF